MSKRHSDEESPFMEKFFLPEAQRNFRLGVERFSIRGDSPSLNCCFSMILIFLLTEVIDLQAIVVTTEGVSSMSYRLFDHLVKHGSQGNLGQWMYARDIYWGFK